MENTTLITSIHKTLNCENIRRCGVNRVYKEGDRSFIKPDVTCCDASDNFCDSCDYLIRDLNDLQKSIFFNRTQTDKYFLNNYLLKYFPLTERLDNSKTRETIKEIISISQEEYEKQIKEYLNKETQDV